MELPLFPLHTVLCPGVALPLVVFEERYLAMVAHCLRTDNPFGVVLIREGREVGGGPTSLATVGTIAEIREVQQSSERRYELLVVGTKRFRIGGVTVGRKPYLVGEVEEIPDPVGDPAAARSLTELVTERFVQYLTLLQPLEGEDADEIDVQVELDVEDDADEATEATDAADAAETPGARLPPVAGLSGSAPWAGSTGSARGGDERLDDVARRVVVPDDPTILSYLLSGIIQVDQPRRQELLEAPTTEARLTELVRLIDRELVLLERRLRNFSVDPSATVVRRN